MQQVSEEQRVAALRRYDVLDSPREEQFDQITAMAARLFNTQFSCITLVDESRFFFKSGFGVDIVELAREPGFCETTIQANGVHAIENAHEDPLSKTHSMVCNAPYIRFYAGAPLVTPEKINIGTLCILDPLSRKFSSSDHKLLRELADFVMFLFDRRRSELARKRKDKRTRNLQQLESLEALARGIVHDFNNLLVGVLGNASLAHELAPADEHLRVAIQHITDAANQAKDLTRQLMVYAGENPRSIRHFDLEKSLSEIVSLARSTAPKNVSIGFEVDPTTPIASGDEVQICQVAMNLISNAIESHRADDGNVIVKLSKRWISSTDTNQHVHGWLEPGPHLSLTVTDDGCGIPAAVSERMFEPYFSTKVSGRGLGMSIVQRIVKDHKGAIDVTSSTDGGTSISVLLPTTLETTEDQDEKRSETDISLQTSGTVLVVDDEELVARTTCLAVGSLGYQALAADSAQDALAMFDKNSNIDVVILDATISNVECGEIVEKIRRRHPKLPAVITSGHQLEDIAAQLGDVENLTFLPKPWTIERVGRFDRRRRRRLIARHCCRGGQFLSLAERGGFEPPVRYHRTLAFQASTLNHSATSPIFPN